MQPADCADCRLCRLQTMQTTQTMQAPVHVPVYDKTKKEITSMSAGKSVDMTDLNHGHNIVN